MKKWIVAPLLAALTMSGLTWVGSGAPAGAAKSLTTANPFRVFSPVDRTGADASIGQFWSTGLNAAVKYVNAHGGVMGKKVVVTYKDTQSNAQTATTITTNALSSGKFQMVIPTAAAASGPPILQIAKRFKTLIIGASSVGNMGTGKAYPYAFVTNVSQPVQGLATACLAQQTYHPKTVAYLYVKTTEWTYQTPQMARVWKKYGVKVVADEGYTFNATDVTPQVEKIQQAHPDVLIIGSFFQYLATAIKAIDALNYTVPVVGNAETSAGPPSSFLSSSTPFPKNSVEMQWKINARINTVLSPQQKQAQAALTPTLKGNYPVAIATFLYTYDALIYAQWAADKAHSTSTPAMAKQLETLGKNKSANTGGLIAPNPGYTATTHWLQSALYPVDINGTFVKGTFPTTKGQPIATCLK